MRSTAARTICLAALLLLVCTVSAGGQTLLDKVQRDETAIVPQDDPEMAQAMRRARATLDAFLAFTDAPASSMTGFAVKVAVCEGDATEYFWISPFHRAGKGFIGRINNTPQIVSRVRLDQIISFTENDIVDWLYFDGGRMKGNYTACALLKREKPVDAEAFKKQYGLDCDF